MNGICPTQVAANIWRELTMTTARREQGQTIVLFTSDHGCHFKIGG